MTNHKFSLSVSNHTFLSVLIDRVSLCSPGRPRTHYVGKVGLEFPEIHLPQLECCETKGACYNGLAIFFFPNEETVLSSVD